MARAKPLNIILDDVAITHLTFSKDFTAAIEAKEVAFQQAETAKFVVQKAEQEKLAKVITAEGDAEAAKMVGDVSFCSWLGWSILDCLLFVILVIGCCDGILSALLTSSNISFRNY